MAQLDIQFGRHCRHLGDTIVRICLLVSVSRLAPGKAQQQTSDITEIRLVGGPADVPNSGRVEAQHRSGIWLNVCDNNWGDNDGEVACRQLGFPGYSRTRTGSYFGEGSNNGSVGGIGCDGDEASLGECRHQSVRESTGCGNRNGVAGLICTAPGYLGCYTDSRGDRVFSTRFSADNMTIGLCLDRCWRQGMRYAGLENKRDCYCGDDGTQIDKHGWRRDRDCRSACAANADEVCGGPGRLSVYDLTLGLCVDPGVPADGGREPPAGGPFRYAANVTFFCNDAFELVGSDATRCVLGASPQEAVWDEPVPVCRGILIPTTESPGTGDDQTGGTGAGQTAGIIVACVVLFILLVLVIVLVIRKRRRRFDKNSPRSTEVHLTATIPSELLDSRYQTSPGVPVPTASNTVYQDLTSPSTDVDRPYTSLRKDQGRVPEKDIPEYLELDSSQEDTACDADAPDAEYATLDEERQDNRRNMARAGAPHAAKQPGFTGRSAVVPAKQHGPRAEVNDNEYSYVDATQFTKDSVTDNQFMNNSHDHDGSGDYADQESAYYSIPPDAL